MGDSIGLGKNLDASQVRDCFISGAEVTSSTLKNIRVYLLFKKTLQIPLTLFNVVDRPASSGR